MIEKLFEFIMDTFIFLSLMYLAYVTMCVLFYPIILFYMNK